MISHYLFTLPATTTKPKQTEISTQLEADIARIAGFREALVRHRIEPGPGWVRIGDPSDLKFVRSLVAGKQADAFICANDNTAALLMRSIEACGFRTPKDFRVAGFDDVKYATLVSPPLTTIHQPCRDLATIAFRTMMERLTERAERGLFSHRRQQLIAPGNGYWNGHVKSKIGLL